MPLRATDFESVASANSAKGPMKISLPIAMISRKIVLLRMECTPGGRISPQDGNANLYPLCASM